MPTTQPVPGQATRRYLDAPRDRGAGTVDWDAAPARYQRYPLAGRVVLPWAPSAASPPADPYLVVVGTLLRHLLGLRTSWAYPISSGFPTGAPPEVVIRRPAPSGGGLYPIEAYVITATGSEHRAALCHYDAAHHCLDLIRAGDHRSALISLLTAPPPALPDVVLVLSAVFWRNGFKYGDFAYRLQCQETGALTAQALALAETLNLRASVHLDFADHHTQALLGLDPTREGVLAVLTFTAHPVPPSPSQAPHPPSYPDLIATPAVQASNPSPPVTELLPHLSALHAAATHRPTGSPHRAIAAPTSPTPRENTAVRLPRGARPRLADGIPTRASTPNGYLPIALEPDSLATTLACATAGYPGDLPDTSRAPLSVMLYVLVHRVAGITPGAYHYQPGTHTLIPVGDPDAIDMLTRARLKPNTRHALPDAAAILLPVGDPLAGTHQYGDRWYRIQQLEAGLMLHRATLAATARGLTTRIHSDGTNDTTDTALGLHTTPQRSLSFLLLGHQRPGITLHGGDRDPFHQTCCD